MYVVFVPVALCARLERTPAVMVLYVVVWNGFELAQCHLRTHGIKLPTTLQESNALYSSS